MSVVCFGDSNTYGYDPRGFFGGRYGSDDRWPELLAKLSGRVVINLGVNGREIPRPDSPPGFLAECAPEDILLVMLGTNDLLQGASAAEASARMEAFLTLLLPQCSNVLLIAPPPLKRGAWVASDALAAESVRLAEAYKLLAKKLGIPFVDTRGWNMELCYDGVHLTEAGHHEFARRVFEYLK